MSDVFLSLRCCHALGNVRHAAQLDEMRWSSLELRDGHLGERVAEEWDSEADGKGGMSKGVSDTVEDVLLRTRQPNDLATGSRKLRRCLFAKGAAAEGEHDKGVSAQSAHHVVHNGFARNHDWWMMTSCFPFHEERKMESLDAQLLVKKARFQADMQFVL